MIFYYVLRHPCCHSNIPLSFLNFKDKMGTESSLPKTRFSVLLIKYLSFLLFLNSREFTLDCRQYMLPPHLQSPRKRFFSSWLVKYLQAWIFNCAFLIAKGSLTELLDPSQPAISAFFAFELCSYRLLLWLSLTMTESILYTAEKRGTFWT